MKQFWLTTLAPMAAIATVCAVWAATSLPAAPNPMATHFGLNGQPDGWSSPAFFYWSMLLVQIFILVLFWWLGRSGGAHGTHARMTTGIVAGAVTLIGLATVEVFALNIEGEPVLRLSDFATMLGWSVLAGLVIAWFCRPVPAPPQPRMKASEVHVPEGATVAWIGYARPSRAVLAVVLGLTALLSILGAAMGSWIVILILVVTLLLAAAFMHFTVTLNHRGLRYRSLLIIPARTIELERIQAVEPVQVNPGEWGGWGFRGVGSNRAIVTRGGEAIRIEYDGGNQLYITVDDAAGAAGTFEALTGR